MILIISHKEDYTVDFVVQKLNTRGHQYHRYNTEDILKNNDIEVSLGNELTVKIGNINKIDAIWYRRVKLPDLDEADKYTKEFIQTELDRYLSNIWNLLNVTWLSHPDSINRAENKLLQLKEANNVGFRIPETLVSSNIETIKNFYLDHDKNVIIKPLYNNQFYDGVSEKVIYTNKLSDYFIDRMEQYVPLPSIYQSYIDKDVEIRVTVIGNKSFSAYVDSQSNIRTKIDWRREKLKFHQYQLPKHVEEKCVKLVKNLNLSFSAIDLIRDNHGNYVFLEVNPNGQWAWIEIDTGLQISDAIIDFLTLESNNKVESSEKYSQII